MHGENGKYNDYFADLRIFGWWYLQLLLVAIFTNTYTHIQMIAINI